MPNGNCKFFVDQIFRIFDADANGYLDFKVRVLEFQLKVKVDRLYFEEFLIAIDMSINGSPEEKLRWGFRIFDRDGSGLGSRSLYFTELRMTGSIELKEMTKIMTCLLELEGIGRVQTDLPHCIEM